MGAGHRALQYLALPASRPQAIGGRRPRTGRRGVRDGKPIRVDGADRLGVHTIGTRNRSAIPTGSSMNALYGDAVSAKFTV